MNTQSATLENPRCCTDCKHVLLSGSPYLEKMSAWGYVGCSYDHKEWTVTSPGFARSCRLYAPMVPGDEVEEPPPPIVVKRPASLFDF